MITEERILHKAKLADLNAKIFVLEEKINSYREGKNPGWFENVMLCRAKINCHKISIKQVSSLPDQSTNILTQIFKS